MDEIEEKIRKIPLAERLEKSLKIVKSISDSRDLRMSVPVQPTDEDVFLVTTLSDALELINSPAVIEAPFRERVPTCPD